jgi:L-seryl-tRNA(Ser) seleniumtransferase
MAGTIVDGGKSELLRCLPSVESVLAQARDESWAAGVPQRVLASAARDAVQHARETLLGGTGQRPGSKALVVAILARTRELAGRALVPHYRRVVNATGIILHTGLGRAVLPAAALRQIVEHLSGYSLLQLDVETGKRGKRDGRIEWLLRELTGAEAATVVNNNAAATLVVLNTVAAGREVIVSRGQLVEIGGSFRLPEVMAASGARMIEVGTTNRTHLRDYESAITGETAAILRVHPSNYKISGFTSEVSLADLVELAHARGLVLIDDVGAGSLVDFSRFGFAEEPSLPASVAAGADLVTSSTDKLIGAGQGGAILGRRDLIAAVRKNPLARAMRMDKLGLAALEATLVLFLDEQTALSEVPSLRMAMRSLDDITTQAGSIAAALAERVGDAAAISTQEGTSEMGSGSLPEQGLPTRLVAVAPGRLTPDELARRLRRHEPPVFARIRDDALLIDPRTLQEGEEPILIAAVVKALEG